MIPVVMIPAMGCDGGLYALLEGKLEGVRGQTCVCHEPSIAANVDRVLAAAPGQFIVLGTSFGGRVALETALAAPDRVSGLVVIGSSSKAVADPAAGLLRERRLRGGEFDKVVAEMSEKVAHLAGPNGAATQHAFVGMAQRLGAEAIANQAAAMARRSDVTGRLAEIECPALLLWGKEDLFSPAQDGLALSMAIMHGRFVEIPDCGHFPSLEAPEETVSILQHWLQDHFLLEA